MAEEQTSCHSRMVLCRCHHVHLRDTDLYYRDFRNFKSAEDGSGESAYADLVGSCFDGFWRALCFPLSAEKEAVVPAAASARRPRKSPWSRAALSRRTPAPSPLPLSSRDS